MKRDALSNAARALREETEREAPRADETRARVMATLRARRGHRRSMVAVVVPLAAALAGSLAWAAASGRLHDGATGREPRLQAPAAPSYEGPTGHEPRPQAPAEPRAVAAPEPPAVAAPEPPAVAAPDAVVPARPEPPRAPARPARPAPSSPRPQPAAVPAGRPEASAVTPQPRPDPSAAGDADQELYAKAHRLHFVDRNPAAALAAWDAYLRAFPRGKLAPESSYNRALCLLRLGRKDEAAAALAGFARGAYGGYRQAEARALLEAMGNTPP